MKMAYICLKKYINQTILCLQTNNSIFENVFHSVNYNDFLIGELNVIVNILKLYADDISFKKIMLETEINCSKIKDIINLFNSLNQWFITHFFVFI